MEKMLHNILLLKSVFNNFMWRIHMHASEPSFIS